MADVGDLFSNFNKDEFILILDFKQLTRYKWQYTIYDFKLNEVLVVSHVWINQYHWFTNWHEYASS